MKFNLILFIVVFSLNAYSCDTLQNKTSLKLLTSGLVEKCDSDKDVKLEEEKCNEVKKEINQSNSIRAMVFKGHTLVKDVRDSANYICKTGEDSYFIYNNKYIVNVKNGNYKLYSGRNIKKIEDSFKKAKED